MRRGYLTAVAGLTVGLGGCDSGPSGPPGTPSYAPAERLAGTWRWVSSFDVRTQVVHTPTTAGYGATLQFTPESARSGTFTYTRAGGHQVTGRFAIGSEHAPGNDFVVLEPGIDYLARNAWVAAGSDSLHLGGVMESGYNSRYVRVIP